MKKTLRDVFDEASASELAPLVDQNPAPDVPPQVLSVIKEKVYAGTGLASPKAKRFPMLRLSSCIAIAACLCLVVGGALHGRSGNPLTEGGATTVLGGDSFPSGASSIANNDIVNNDVEADSRYLSAPERILWALNHEACFIGSVVPLEYQFYKTFEYRKDTGEWVADGFGYVEYTCRIIDISDYANTTEYCEDDVIVLRAYIDVQPKTEEAKKAFQEKIGIPVGEPTEEEIPKNGPITRALPVPQELVKAEDCRLLRTSNSDHLWLGVQYDVFVSLEYNKEYGRANYVTPSEKRYTEQYDFSGSYHAINNEEFRHYLAKNREQLGLKNPSDVKNPGTQTETSSWDIDVSVMD